MFLIAGHRGAAGLRPENTLAGVDLAVALGCDYVEVDVRPAADGAPMVIHDPRLERTTNGTGLVREHTAEQLRRLDAGGGEPVPLLGEVLARVRGRCRFLCEIKDEAVADAAVDAVRRAGMAGDTTFISFEHGALRRVRAVDASLAIAPLFFRPKWDDFAVADALQAGAIDLNFGAISFDWMAQFREAGWQVLTYTPNAPHEFAAMHHLGVDVLTTDRPDELIAYRARHAAGA